MTWFTAEDCSAQLHNLLDQNQSQTLHKERMRGPPIGDSSAVKVTQGEQVRTAS